MNEVRWYLELWLMHNPAFHLFCVSSPVSLPGTGSWPPSLCHPLGAPGPLVSPFLPLSLDSLHTPPGLTCLTWVGVIDLGKGGLIYVQAGYYILILHWVMQIMLLNCGVGEDS